MNRAIIVDLDGTLCNSQHRMHFIESKPKNWDAFYESASKDQPNEWAKSIVDIYSRHTDFCILFVTGRPYRYYSPTMDWILRYFPQFCTANLFMRKNGDFRVDTIVKKEIFEKQIKEHFDVLFCLEDRLRVAEMWRQLGLVCLLSSGGDF